MAEGKAFANTEAGVEMTTILFDAFVQTQHTMLAVIGNVWKLVKSKMTFDYFNKLLLSLWKNGKLNLHTDSFGNLVFVVWNKEDYIKRRKELL